jgi:hypothetical protein
MVHGNKIFEPELNEKLFFLLEDNCRYKGAKGGRGASKSMSFCDAVLAKMISRRINVCAGREVHNTIGDSVHRLIQERINYHKLDKIFVCTQTGFKYLPNGSELTYTHFENNKDKIRGLQGVDLFWIFEAHTLTKESWLELYPTIRRDNSEIWFEWNQDTDEDFVDSIFSDPENAAISKLVYITYLDNPLCSQVNLDDANRCLARAKRTGDWEEYNHEWLGYPSKLGSRIYPMFTKERHIIYAHELDDSRFFNESMYFMGQDPATVYYPFCVWIQRIHKGDGKYKYVVYNEFPTLSMMGGKYFWEKRDEAVCELPLKKRAGLFRVLDNTTPDRIYPTVRVEGVNGEFSNRAVDTRFAKASGAASTTLGGTQGMIITWAMPENGAMRFNTPPERMIDVQRDNIRAAMSYDEDLGYIPGLNEPSWYVMPHCYNVIDACLHHRMDNDKKTEHPKRKDVMDAIRICHAYMSQVPHRPQVVVEEPEMVRELHGYDKAKKLREAFEKRSVYA